jgi:thiol-disulfide isomerase/thioredoxin
MLGIYEDFLSTNPFMELDKLVTDALNRHQPEQKRRPASNFSLPDTNQVRRSLRDWQGKWVYIDFWATWCRPCIKKMIEMQPLEAQWKDKIAFVHISLDANPQIWLDFIRENKLLGIHLYSSPKSQTLLDYEVLAVPRYFIISPDGNFEFAPATLDVSVIGEHLSKLLD